MLKVALNTALLIHRCELRSLGSRLGLTAKQEEGAERACLAGWKSARQEKASGLVTRHLTLSSMGVAQCGWNIPVTGPWTLSGHQRGLKGLSSWMNHVALFDYKFLMQPSSKMKHFGV